MPDPSSPPLGVLPVERCPVCGSNGRPRYHDVVDHTFGVPGSWSFRACERCRSLWLDPRPRDDQLGLAYVRYYTHGEGDAEAAPGGDRAKALLRHLPGHGWDGPGAIGYLDGLPAGRVLDVGCGDGRTIVALQRAGWACVGIDPDPASIAAAEAAGAVDVRVGTIDGIDAPAGSFDAIVSIHSLEHVPDPGSMVAAAWSLLRPGGTLSIVTPNAESWLLDRHGPRWRGLEAPRHLQVFTGVGLELLLQSAGYEDVRTMTTPRGTNAIARAHRRDPSRGGGRLGTLVDYGLGELWQGLESLVLRRRPSAGEELVARAVRPDDR